jgi:hypothetical protein
MLRRSFLGALAGLIAAPAVAKVASAAPAVAVPVAAPAAVALAEAEAVVSSAMNSPFLLRCISTCVCVEPADGGRPAWKPTTERKPAIWAARFERRARGRLDEGDIDRAVEAMTQAKPLRAWRNVDMPLSRDMLHHAFGPPIRFFTDPRA